MNYQLNTKNAGLLNMAVIVSALGYFVDLFDVLLFSIIRKPSLTELGLSKNQILENGEILLSIQMIGLLVGGVIFGIIGDRKGRLSVLFGSILIYSIANILNGLITNINQYMILRFISGVGLAGELGAGITLVAELLPKEKRGIAAAIVGGFGFFGALFAVFIAQLFSWRMCYFIGGAMGFVLLLGRIQINESMMFKRLGTKMVSKGNFLMFFNNKTRASTYIKCILIGVPSWFVIGGIVSFADKFGEQFGIENVTPGKAILFAYIGLIVGDIVSALICQYMRSRKKTISLFYLILSLVIALFFIFKGGGSVFSMYLFYIAIGFGIGFAIITVTLNAEQFGTNLRATAAISIPNMIRGSLPLSLLLFKLIRNTTGNYINAAWITTAILIIIAMIALNRIKESYGKDLDFLEH